MNCGKVQPHAACYEEEGYTKDRVAGKTEPIRGRDVLDADEVIP